MSGSQESVWIDVDGRVIVSGDIDVVSAPVIEASIRQAESELVDGSAVQIDVRQVGFIDSSGLRVLLAASRRNDGDGRRVQLHAPGHTLIRLLDITGTSMMFDLVEPQS